MTVEAGQEPEPETAAGAIRSSAGGAGRGAWRGLAAVVAVLLVAACSPAKGPSAEVGKAAASHAAWLGRPRPAMPAGPCTLPGRSSFGAYLGEGLTDWTHHLRPAGVIRAVTLFVDFPDAPAPRDDVELLDDEAAHDAEQWYRENSYGWTNLRVTHVRRWLRLPHRSGEYSFADYYAQAAYIRDAIVVADPTVDFRAYDVVYVVPTTAAKKVTRISYADTADTGAGVRADGVEMRRAVTFGRDAYTFGSVIAHETGHLFGLPDLYRVADIGRDDGQLSPWVGTWDVMGDGTLDSRLLGWHRWKLGWLNPTQVACVSRPGRSTHALTPIGTPGGLKVVVVRTGPTTALVAEARAEADGVYGGVLVYHVDAAVPTGEGPVRIRDAHSGPSDPGSLDDAPYEVGPGPASAYRDRQSGVVIEVVRQGGGGYVIDVARS